MAVTLYPLPTDAGLGAVTGRIIYTVSDALSALRDYAGTTTDQNVYRAAYRACQVALDSLAAAHPWNYYLRRYRLTTNADYSTGTVEYTHSSRTVTLTSGTFPSWTPYGVIVISDIHYPVWSNPTSTTLVLGSDLNPGVNVASGTSYSLYRDTYFLPPDFQSIESNVTELQTCNWLEYLDQNDFNNYRSGNLSPSTPYAYTITRDRNWLGPTNANTTLPGMAFIIRPPANAVKNYEFFYRFRPRDLNVPAGIYNTGNISTSNITVTGSSTAFTQDMVGAVIRFGTAQNAPDGRQSAYKYGSQRFVTAVGSATSLTIDSALTTEVSAVKYEITDPIDVEPGGMWKAYLRMCEHEFSIARHKDNPRAIEAAGTAARFALREAMASDARSAIRERRKYVDQLGTITFTA